MRGFWADERVDGNLWKLNNPLFKTIYGFFKRKEKEFLENADEVITLTHAAQEEIHSWGNITGNPIHISVIPCCVDMEKFSQSKVDPFLKEKLKTELNIEDTDYILSYLGSLGTWYMLDEMLDLAAKGIDKSSVIIAHSSFEKVPTYISLSNASIFFIKPAYSKKGSSPIKQGELMSMGIPVVCNSNVGDTDWIVRKYHSGIVVETFDKTGYEKAVSELLKHDFDHTIIIDGAKDYFSLEVGVKEYMDVYKKLLD